MKILGEEFQINNTKKNKINKINKCQSTGDIGVEELRANSVMSRFALLGIECVCAVRSKRACHKFAYVHNHAPCNTDTQGVGGRYCCMQC